MSKQVIFDWLKQRPWLLVPALGVIPLVSLPFIKGNTSNPEAGAVSSAGLPLATSPSQTPSPSLLTQNSPSLAPNPTPKNSPSVKASPSVKVSPNPATITAKPVTPPRNTDPRIIQSVVNLSADSAIQMRVAIAEGVSSFSLATTAGAVIVDTQKGKPLNTLSPQAAYPVQNNGASIFLGSTQLPQAVYVEPTPGGLISIGDRTYRGRMLIAVVEGGLWVVNHVSLQQYLYSVVGSEVSSSWPMEALKAQAVAARSYALTYHLKPASRIGFWDLGATEYYQVYKGIETEAPTTRQAVNSTGGEFVSYRGGVVESLYAATDDIVMEAFQGKGMSQIGALGLAEKGHTYRQILAIYYTGTGVGRIEMDME
jgi:peptidoglycan hydrolase-like amidase